MKLTYPVCCGIDVHKTFLVATIITSEYVMPRYHQKRFSTFYNGLVAFKKCCLNTTAKTFVWRAPASIGFLFGTSLKIPAMSLSQTQSGFPL